MSIIIGITGGIGSGKSTIANIFANLGVPVFDADATAKFLMNTNSIIKEKLIATFGANVYMRVNEQSDEQVLNKAYLSKQVFENPNQLALLNAIVHPITIQAAADWAATQHAPYVIKEAALFFESGSLTGVSRVIGVSAPKSLRIHRVMKRENCTKEAVEQRMKHQIDDTLKMKLCDWVIVNDDQQLVLPQVIAVHEKILSLL
jgi:dephospho-CoA kinase